MMEGLCFAIGRSWILSCLALAGVVAVILFAGMTLGLFLWKRAKRIQREFIFSRRFSALAGSGKIPDSVQTVGLYLAVFPDRIKPKGGLSGLMRRQILRLHFNGAPEETLTAARELAARLSAKECFEQLVREDALALAAAVDAAGPVGSEASGRVMSLAPILLCKDRRISRLCFWNVFLLLFVCGLLTVWAFPKTSALFPWAPASDIVQSEPLMLNVEMEIDE